MKSKHAKQYIWWWLNVLVFNFRPKNIRPITSSDPWTLLWSGHNWREEKSSKSPRINTTQKSAKNLADVGNCFPKSLDNLSSTKPNDFVSYIRKSIQTTNTSRARNPKALPPPPVRDLALPVPRARPKAASAFKADPPVESISKAWTTNRGLKWGPNWGFTTITRRSLSTRFLCPLLKWPHLPKCPIPLFAAAPNLSTPASTI